jgi:hypothetical protein
MKGCKPSSGAANQREKACKVITRDCGKVEPGVKAGQNVFGSPKADWILAGDALAHTASVELVYSMDRDGRYWKVEVNQNILYGTIVA